MAPPPPPLPTLHLPLWNGGSQWATLAPRRSLPAPTCLFGLKRTATMCLGSTSSGKTRRLLWLQQLINPRPLHCSWAIGQCWEEEVLVVEEEVLVALVVVAAAVTAASLGGFGDLPLRTPVAPRSNAPSCPHPPLHISFAILQHGSHWHCTCPLALLLRCKLLRVYSSSKVSVCISRAA